VAVVRLLREEVQRQPVFLTQRLSSSVI